MVEVELKGLVVEFNVGHLCHHVLEMALLPGLRGVGHHRQDSIVVLLVLVVEEDKLRPEVGLLSSTENLPWVRGGGEGKGERERMIEVVMCILMYTVH